MVNLDILAYLLSGTAVIGQVCYLANVQICHPLSSKSVIFARSTLAERGAAGGRARRAGARCPGQALHLIRDGRHDSDGDDTTGRTNRQARPQHGEPGVGSPDRAGGCAPGDPPGRGDRALAATPGLRGLFAPEAQRSPPAPGG